MRTVLIKAEAKKKPEEIVDLLGEFISGDVALEFELVDVEKSRARCFFTEIEWTSQTSSLQWSESDQMSVGLRLDLARRGSIATRGPRTCRSK